MRGNMVDLLGFSLYSRSITSTQVAPCVGVKLDATQLYPEDERLMQLTS